MKYIKRFAALFMCILLVLSFAACGNKGDAGSDALTTELTTAEMEESLKVLARRLENQLRANDPYAEVEFRVEEDGTCAFWVAGTDDNGEVQEKTRLDTGENNQSVEDMFMTYMAAGFLNASGEVTGFPDEIPEDQLAQAGSSSQNTAEDIIENTPLSGEQTQVAGFPGEGSIDATPSSSSASTADESASTSVSESTAQ